MLCYVKLSRKINAVQVLELVPTKQRIVNEGGSLKLNETENNEFVALWVTKNIARKEQ